jgi:hypothetical protein
MRAHILALAVAAALAAPAAALAQPLDRNLENELRMRQAQEDLRNFEIQQRQQQTVIQLDDLDRRVRTQQNLDSIRPPPGPVYQPMDTAPVRLIPNAIDLNAQAALLNRELSSENARNKR